MPAYLRKGASPQRAVIFILFAHTKAPMAAEIYPGPFAKEAQITTQCFWTRPLYQVRNSKEGVNFGITYGNKIKPDNLGNIFPMGTDAI